GVLGYLVVAAVRVRPEILVDRMRRHTVFGHTVHLAGADLQFHALARGSDDRGVDRAVVVLLGRRDIILETARNHRPGRVDRAERGIAVLDGVHDHTEAEDVGKLLERESLGLHLAKDGPRLLLPAL